MIDKWFLEGYFLMAIEKGVIQIFLSFEKRITNE